MRERVTAAGHVPPAAVMVGDREHDLAGAEAHHLASAWAGWGYGSPREGTAETRAVLRPEGLAEAVIELLGTLDTAGV